MGVAAIGGDWVAVSSNDNLDEVYELAFLPASIPPVRCCGNAVAQCRSSYPLCLSVNVRP